MPYDQTQVRFCLANDVVVDGHKRESVSSGPESCHERFFDESCAASLGPPITRTLPQRARKFPNDANFGDCQARLTSVKLIEHLGIAAMAGGAKHSL